VKSNSVTDARMGAVESSSDDESSSDHESSSDGTEISQDVVLDVLSNQRRRFTVHHLKQQDGGPITVSELAEQVASWENNTHVDALTHAERKRVSNALRQFHLPKMADYEFVDYESNRGTVSLTPVATNTEFYIDALTGRQIPWGLYYFGSSVVSGICLVGLWIELYPLTLLSPLVYGAFLVSFFVFSSVGHLYDNYYRMRLGARHEPLEVETQ